MIGTVVGNYRILAELSAGGMGMVYRAEHTLIGRPAAVKVLHSEMCSNKDIVQRFFNEAKATTAIKHPGIVEIFDFGFMPSGDAYLVMEFLEGMSLAQRMKLRCPIHEGEAAMIIRGICGALGAAHAKGIVHRDLKPDNIFVIPDAESPTGERYKLLDFGIAKLTDIGLAGTATKTGSVMGTPTYMSPEQCRGTGAVDHRADLYSLGCILYQLVAGRPPFTQLGAGELIGAHVFVQPEPPSRHVDGLSAELEGLIMSLLDKEPARRVQTARDLGMLVAQIASAHGWQVPVDAERISMQYVTPTGQAFSVTSRPTITPDGNSRPMLTPAGNSRPMLTPAGNSRPMLTPAGNSRPMLTPAGNSPTVTPVFSTPQPSTTTGNALAAEWPTTLSSAVGQTQQPSTTTSATRRPRALAIGLSVGGLAIIGVVAFVGLRHSHRASETSAAVTPASAATSTPPHVLTPTTPAPTMAQTPAPTTTPATPTPPVATPPVVAPPVAAPPVAAPPVAAPPVPTVSQAPDTNKPPELRTAAISKKAPSKREPTRTKLEPVKPKPDPAKTEPPKPKQDDLLIEDKL